MPEEEMKERERLATPEGLTERPWKQNLASASESFRTARDLFNELLSDASQTGRRNVDQMLRTLVPLSLAASYLLSACSGTDQQSTATTPSGEGDTGPRTTEVVPPTETPTQLPPTETPTLIPTPTEVPPTETATAIPETVYRFDGIEVTQTELDGWAEKLPFCNNCMTNNNRDMAFVFTDKYVTFEDTRNGVKIKTDAAVIVTKIVDQNGNVVPKILYFEFQKERGDKPGFNEQWGFTLNALLGFPVDMTPYMSNPDKSIHDPTEISRALAGILLEVELKDFEPGDPDYEKLKEMVKTGGDSLDNNDPIMLWIKGYNPMNSDGTSTWLVP